MPVIISMLRGINVGGHNKINMGELRGLYESLGFETPRTYVQSGNVIFRSKEKISPVLASKIQHAIERKFACSPGVILRTPAEFRRAIDSTPFPPSRSLEPGKVLITFLATDPGPGAHATLLKLKRYPEEIHLNGRELYIYFPNGAGKSKLPWASIAEVLKTQGTARNWSSVAKILAIAEELEASAI